MKGRASAVRKCKRIVRDVALALVVYSNYNKKCIEHQFVQFQWEVIENDVLQR